MKAAGVSCPSHSNIIQPMCELGPIVPKNLIWSNYITTRCMAIEPNCMCFKASACKITSQPTGKATRMWNATAIPVCAHAARNKIKLAKPAHFMDDLKSESATKLSSFAFALRLRSYKLNMHLLFSAPCHPCPKRGQTLDLCSSFKGTQKSAVSGMPCSMVSGSLLGLVGLTSSRPSRHSSLACHRSRTRPIHSVKPPSSPRRLSNTKPTHVIRGSLAKRLEHVGTC